MPRQKKDSLSPAVGTVNTGRKIGNPDFVSSSFYVPKRINGRFNSAIETLKAEGFFVDRSDLLSVFMDRFATAVREAEDAGEGFDLQAILEKSNSGSLEETAGVSAYKTQLRESVDALNAAKASIELDVQEMKKKLDAMASPAD